MSEECLPSGQTPAGFDLDRFRQLIAVVGTHRQLLLDHAISDLSKVRNGLGVGDVPLAAIREHSHVLSALAGTLGETRLQAMSEMLNREAHAGRTGDIPAILDRLDDLLGFLGRQKCA